jgi:hypothetical protein
MSIQPISVTDLEGNKVARRFEGAAHGFVSSGDVDLHQISIHAAGRMVQEWLED